MGKPYQPHQIFRMSSRPDSDDEVFRDTTEVRENIERDVKEFLDNGGVIQMIPSVEVERTTDPAFLELVA